MNIETKEDERVAIYMMGAFFFLSLALGTTLFYGSMFVQWVQARSWPSVPGTLEQLSWKRADPVKASCPIAVTYNFQVEGERFQAQRLHIGGDAHTQAGRKRHEIIFADLSRQQKANEIKVRVHPEDRSRSVLVADGTRIGLWRGLLFVGFSQFMAFFCLRKGKTWKFEADEKRYSLRREEEKKVFEEAKKEAQKWAAKLSAAEIEAIREQSAGRFPKNDDRMIYGYRRYPELSRKIAYPAAILFACIAFGPITRFPGARYLFWPYCAVLLATLWGRHRAVKDKWNSIELRPDSITIKKWVRWKQQVKVYAARDVQQFSFDDRNRLFFHLKSGERILLTRADSRSEARDLIQRFEKEWKLPHV